MTSLLLAALLLGGCGGEYYHKETPRPIFEGHPEYGMYDASRCHVEQHRAWDNRDTGTVIGLVGLFGLAKLVHNSTVRGI